MKTRKVIIHNSVSLDGSIRGFDVDMQAHYAIAGNYKADVHLIGSNTAITGIQTFCPEIPKEEPGDFQKPNETASSPYGSFQTQPENCTAFSMCTEDLICVGTSLF